MVWNKDKAARARSVRTMFNFVASHFTAAPLVLAPNSARWYGGYSALTAPLQRCASQLLGLIDETVRMLGKSGRRLLLVLKFGRERM